MKKFMIYFLMAFLVIGTCQARSEVVTGNLANAKALTYAYSPTISQCLTSHPFAAPLPVTDDTWDDVEVGIGIVDLDNPQTEAELMENTSVQLWLYLGDDDLFDLTKTKWEMKKGDETEWTELPDFTGKDSVVTDAANSNGTLFYRVTAYNKTNPSLSKSAELKITYLDAQHYPGFSVMAKTVAINPNNPTAPFTAIVAQDVCGTGVFGLQLTTQNDDGRATDTLYFRFYDQDGKLLDTKKRDPLDVSSSDNRGSGFIVDATPYVDAMKAEHVTSKAISFYGTITTVKGPNSISTFTPVIYSQPVTVTFHTAPEVDTYVASNKQTVCVGDTLEIAAKIVENTGLDNVVNYFGWDIVGVDESGSNWTTVQASSRPEQVIGNAEKQLYKTDNTPNYDTIRARVEVYQSDFLKSQGCYATDTIDVVVYDNPTISVEARPDTICVSDTLRAVASVKTVDHRLTGINMNYTWYSCDDAQGTNPQQVQTGSTKGDSEFKVALEGDPGVYYYMVEAKYDSTDIPGCETEPTMMKVVVIAPPVFTYVNTDTLCYGGEANLSAEATIEFKNGYMEYMWESLANDKETVTDTLPPVRYFSVDNKNATTGVLEADSFFRVTAQFFFNGQIPMKGCVVDSTILVKVYPDPEITFFPEDFTMCKGGDSTLLVRATNNAEPISKLYYAWQINGRDASSTDSVLTFVTTANTEPGVYQITVTVYNQEKVHESCLAYDTVYVSVIEPAQIELTDADSICYGGTAFVEGPALTVDSCADMNFKYFWSEGEGASHTTWTKKDTIDLNCSEVDADRMYSVKDKLDLTVVNKDFDTLQNNTAKFYFNLVSDMPGCSVKDSTMIYLYPDPVIENVPDSTFVCEGNPSLQVYPRVTTSMPYTRDVNYKYILVEAPANFRATLPDTIAKGTQTYANPLNVDDVFTSYDTIVPGTYNFELVVEDAEELGCDVRDTFTVVVVKDPEIIVPNDTLLCEDGSVKLEFTVINHAMEYVSQNPNLQELNYNFALVDANTPDQWSITDGSGALNKDTNKVEVTISKETVSELQPSVNPYRLVLTVSNNGSCSGCDCDAVSDSVKILVDAKPNTELEYTSIEVCPGAEVVFAGAAFEDEYLTEKNPFRYFWKALNANDTVTFTSTPNVKKAVTDTLDIDYTKPVATNIYGIDTVIFSGLETIGAHQFVLTTFSDFSGCEKTDTFTVYVTEEKIHITSNNDTICQRYGDEAEFVANVTFDIVKYTYDYQWTYGSGSDVVVLKEEKDLPVAPGQQTLTLSQATITSDVEEIKHFFDSLKEGTHYITLNVHQDTTDCEMSFTDTLVVYPNPSVTIDTNYLKPCPGYNTILTLKQDTWNPEFVYYWSMKDSLTGEYIFTDQLDLNSFPTLTTTPFDEDEVRIYYIKALNEVTGCYSEDSIIIHTAKNPIEELLAVPSALEVCAGTPVFLDGIIKPEEKPDIQTYEWFKCEAEEVDPGSGIFTCPEFDLDNLCPHYSDALDTLDTFEDAMDEGGVFCYHLLANTEGYNCPIHATTPLIKVHPNIQVELTADHDTICSGGSVVVSATITNSKAYFKHAPSDKHVFYYRVFENGMPISEEMSTLPGDTVISFITNPSLHENENNATAYVYQIRVSGFSFLCHACDTNSCYSMVPGVRITVLSDPMASITGPTVLPFGYTDSMLVCNVSRGYGEVTEVQWYKENVLIEGATGDTLRLPADLAYGDHHYYAAIKQSGCGCEAITSEFVLHVMDTIILDVDVNGYDCSQKTASITVTPVGDASSINRYHWVLDGEELSEATNVLNNAAPGKYTIEAIMAGGVVAATAEVELPDYGTLQVAITPASPQNVALNGQSTSVTYTAQVAGGSGSYTYQWYMSGENGTEQPIAGANAEVYNTPSNMAAGQYYYFVEVTDSASGCSAKSGIVQAIVANDILVRIEGIESACEGSIVTLTAIVEGDQIGHKYQWKYFGDYIVGATEPQYVINTDSLGAGNHEFYVEITRDGCESVLSPVFYFNVIETPVVLAKGDTNLCPGATTTFVAETFSSMIEQPYKWIWFTSDSDTVAVTYENYYNFDEAGKYFVESVFATSICSAVSDTFEIVPARELKEIEIKEANDLYVMCDGGQVNFSIIDSNLTNAEDSIYFGTPYYQWYVNGKKIGGADKNYYSSSPLTADYDVTNYLYAVEVTYSNYTCAIATDTFNVQVVANPTVVISGDPVICAGNNIHLTANANDTITGDTLAVQYEWRLDNVTIAEGKELDSLFEASVDPYNFTVVVTRNAGCRTESAPFQVLVNAAPVVNITATDTVICEGGEATFTANLNDYNADELMYQWTMVADGDTTELAGATKDAYTAKNLTAGEYEFIVAVSQKTSDCVVGDTFKLNVIADPVIDSISVSDTMICEGAPIVVTAFVTKSDSINGAATYTWYKNGALMEGIVDSTFTDYPTVTDGDQAEFVYSAVVTLAGTGCDAKMVYSKTVVVNANPTVVISGDPIICNGTNVHLTANVNDTLTDAAEITYEWRLDNVKIAEGKELDTLMNDSIDPYTFTVVVNRNNGCEAVSAPFQVLVNAAPIVTVTATDTAICEGGDVTFTANLADYNADNLMYQWAVVDGDTTEIAGATQATYTAKNLTAGNYEYIVTVGQKTSDCEATGSAKLTVVADPVIDSISVSDTMICEGAPIVVTAFVTKNDSINGAATYTWYKNGALMEGVVDSTFTDYLTVTDGDQAEFVYSAVVTLAGTGCDAKMVYSKTVVVNANPSVVISGDPIICNGTNVHLTANVNDTLTDAAEITYEWRLDNVKIAEGKELDTLMNDSIDPYTFTVVVNRNNGCEAVSAPFQVLVNAAPIVTVTATDTAICEGGEATFTANLADYNADNLMYQWTKVVDGDTTEIAGATQATYNAKNLTAGEYEFIVSVGQKTSDCVAGDTIKLTVVADPKIDSITFSQTEICEGGAVEIEAIDSLAFEGEAVYTWYRNGQVLEGINGKKFVEYALTTDGDSTVYTYAVKVTQPISGCESEVYTAEQTVTVYANPTVEVEVAGSPVVCEGGQVTLTANVVGGTADTEYQWYKDNVAMEGETNNTLTIADLTARETSYNFFVEIKQGKTGCNNKSNVVEVTVVKAPVVTIASNYDAICEGGTATLTATIEGGVAGVNGLGTYNYIWKQNGETVAEGQDTYTLPDDLTAGDYAYQLTVEPADSAYNCGATSNVANVQVVADPEVTIKVAETYDADVCEGGKTFLVSEVTGGIGENSYQWYRNGIILAGETNPTLVTDPELAAGTYEYTLYVTQTGVECAAWSNELEANVLEVPDVTIEGADNVCVGGTVTLTAEVTPADESYTEYQWYRNGTAIYGANTPSYVTSNALSAGDYTYTVTIKNLVSGCVAQSAAVDANVVADPKVVIKGAQDVCEGGSVVLTAEVIGGIEGAEYEYAWYLNGEQIAGANQSTYTTPTSLEATNTADHYYYTVEITPVVDGATNHGCNAISESVIADVIEGPVAVITGNGTICEGGSVTLVANVATPGTYYYKWFLNGEEIAGATNATYTTPNTLTEGTQQYSVEVAAGKSNSNCTYTATADVEVVADPVVTAEASITEMCVGGKTVLTATVTGGMENTENVTYRWTRNGEVISNVTGATFTDMLTVAGTYEYVVTVEQTESTILTGCAAESEPITVEVANQPDVTIVWDGLLDVCEGGSIELTAQIEGGVGEYEYQWRRNNRILPDNGETLTTDNSLTYGEYIYTVTAVPTVESCKQTSDQVTTHVVTQPYWTSTVVRYPEMCEGEIIELAATVKGGVQDNNGNNGGFIIWKKFSDGAESGVDGELGGFSYDIAKEGTYFYYPTYNGPMGSNCVLEAPEGTKVEVHATPTAIAETAEGSDIICTYETAEIIVSFTGTAPFTFFVQDMNTNATTSYTTYENPYSIFVTPSKTTTYHIYSLGDAFCEAAPNAADSYVTVVVSDMDFDTNFVKVCPDENATATFHVTAISGNPTAFSTTGLSDYGMNDYTDEPFDGSNINIDFTGAEPGDYEFTILIDECIYPVTVRVLMGAGGAGKVVEQRWDDVVVANNNPETNGGYRFVAYQWYKNGEPIPGATGQYYNEVGGLNGYYSLWAMTEDGRVFESCEIAIATAARIKVYPTPAHVDQEVTIELPLTEEELEGGVLDIYDDKGALVQHISVIEQVTKVRGFHAAGTYFGRVTTGTNEIKTVKFIIVH